MDNGRKWQHKFPIPLTRMTRCSIVFPRYSIPSPSFQFFHLLSLLLSHPSSSSSSSFFFILCSLFLSSLSLSCRFISRFSHSTPSHCVTTGKRINILQKKKKKKKKNKKKKKKKKRRKQTKRRNLHSVRHVRHFDPRRWIVSSSTPSNQSNISKGLMISTSLAY